MKGHQDIEEQLAGAQDAWDAAPAPELWDRLEQRLDGHSAPSKPRNSRKWIFRIVSIALLATVGIGIWSSLPTSQAAIPKGKAFFSHETKIERSTQPISMGADLPSVAQPSNRLQFGNNVGIGDSRFLSASKPVIGKLEKPIGIESRQSIFSMNGSGRLLLDGETSAASPTYNGNTQIGPSYAPLITTPSLLPGQLPMVVSNSVGNPIDTVGSLQQFRNFTVNPDNAYLQLNVATNQMNFNYVNPARAQANRQDLQHLKWLLGNWKTQGTSGAAMEEWRQKDDFTMVGRGYFVVNGDTIVTEEMRIEQRGPNVYFIIAKDQNQRSVKFRLRSSQPHELIFENTSHESEDEIVLRNLPETDEVERIYQPAPRKDPASSKMILDPPKAMKVMQRK